MGFQEPDPLAQLRLPPGFRFYPTDEELMVQYLCKKVAGHNFSPQIIAEIDLYKFDPWILPSKAMFGEKEWYFFSPRDRKYPNGSRPNRGAGSGYWKATGTDKVITTEGYRVGIKKALVFYIGKAPKGTKTNWIMHEYRLVEPSRKNGSSNKLDEWVLCRIYKKRSSSQKQVDNNLARRDYSNNGSLTSSSFRHDDVLASLQETQDRSFSFPVTNTSKPIQNDGKTGFNDPGMSGFGWASLTGLNTVPELEPNQAVPNHVYNDSTLLGRLEEEARNRFRTQRVDSLGMLTQGLSSNSVDPHGFRHQSQPDGFGFM